MGDTRIDGSTPKNPYPECDEETGVCGGQKKPEVLPQYSRDLSEDQSHAGVGDWHAPMLPDPKPTQVAEVAKNMSSPPLNNSASKEEGWKDHSVAHVGLTKDRDGVEAQLAFHKTDDVTFLDVGGEASEQQFGPHATFLHGKKTEKLGGLDVSVSVDVGAVEAGPGIHNADGSTGLHLGGTATSVGVEGTVHKDGWGSVTGGLGGGVSAEGSLGVKKEGKTTEVCARASALTFTVGACFPVWRD